MNCISLISKQAKQLGDLNVGDGDPGISHSDPHSLLQEILNEPQYVLGTNIGARAAGVQNVHDSVLKDSGFIEADGQWAPNPTNH